MGIYSAPRHFVEYVRLIEETQPHDAGPAAARGHRLESSIVSYVARTLGVLVRQACYVTKREPWSALFYGATPDGVVVSSGPEGRLLLPPLPEEEEDNNDATRGQEPRYVPCWDEKENRPSTEWRALFDVSSDISRHALLEVKAPAYAPYTEILLSHATQMHMQMWTTGSVQTIYCAAYFVDSVSIEVPRERLLLMLPYQVLFMAWTLKYMRRTSYCLSTGTTPWWTGIEELPPDLLVFDYGPGPGSTDHHPPAWRTVVWSTKDRARLPQGASARHFQMSDLVDDITGWPPPPPSC